MLDQQLLNQLKDYFKKLDRDVTLLLPEGNHEKSAELKDMLDSVASTSDRINVDHIAGSEDEATDNPDGITFEVLAADKRTGIRFRGIPGGHEFSSLILAILQAGGVPVRLDPDVVATVGSISEDLHFETVVSLDCHNCPDVVQTLNALSIVNDSIHHDMIDGALYPEVVQKYGVQGVPAVFLNGKPFSSGKVDAATIIGRLMERAGEQSAKHKDTKDSLDSASAETMPLYDVAVLGGGPGGVAAAIYSARKGLKVVVVADRLGGQVKDTMDIENLIAIPATTGPHLAGTLSEQLKRNGVVVREHIRVESIEKDDSSSEVITHLNTGGIVRSKTAIVATGAKWREMNVPGEMENLGRGVAFCPHCDGPFFKGKDVAVIGGGNSGVEAALDLAGITKSVTVLEFAADLKADQVLQERMQQRSNIRVIKSALTTEVLSNANGVTGLRYTDRLTNDSRELELDGIFVQIGLLPNSGFAEGLLERNKMGEILVDERCQTNVGGIFACGDVTNVPYKQIVVALGHGATASLSAFDYLIRNASSWEATADSDAEEVREPALA